MKIGIGSISIPSPFLLKIQSIPRPRIPITLPVVVLCFRRGERRGGKSGRSESTYVTRGGRKGWQDEKSNGEVKERERERVLDCRGRPSMLPFVITNASIFRPCPPVQLSLSLSFYLSFHSLSAELACQWHAETRRRIFPPFLFFLSLLPFFLNSSPVDREISIRGPRNSFNSRDF